MLRNSLRNNFHVVNKIKTIDYVDQFNEHCSAKANHDFDINKYHGLYFVFQPIVNLEKKQLIGVEALARYRGCCGREITPDIFMPHIESEGFLHGHFILSLGFASDFYHRLHKQGFECPISINANAELLESPGFISTFWKNLNELNLSPHSVKLEIIEKTEPKDFIMFAKNVSELIQGGIAVVIDDFGSGHANLKWISMCAFSGIKLDAQFVKNNFQSNVDRVIVESIWHMLERLGLVCTVEGIESVEQLKFMMSIGYDNFQGYLIGKPKTASHFTSEEIYGLAA